MSPQSWLSSKRQSLIAHIQAGRDGSCRKLMNNTVVRYSPYDDEEEYAKVIIKYHNTDVIEYGHDYIYVDCKGWLTPTTKLRLNEHTPFRFSSVKGEWYFAIPCDGYEMIYDYVDGMQFTACSDSWDISIVKVGAV